MKAGNHLEKQVEERKKKKQCKHLLEGEEHAKN
jgi:hypothetical protein